MLAALQGGCASCLHGPAIVRCQICVLNQTTLQENYTNYDKGVLAEILEPIMGKGLIPAGEARVRGCCKRWVSMPGRDLQGNAF